MKTKFLQILFGLLLAWVSPHTLRAWNDGDRFTVGTYTYEVVSAEDETVALIACTGSGKATIKSTVDMGDVNFKVVAVGNADYIVAVWSSGITTVEFESPSNVTTLAEYAFRGSQITSLNIPASVTNIVSTFPVYGLPSTLKTITVADGNPRYQAQGGVLYTKGLKTLIFCPQSTTQLTASNTTFTVPNGVDSIASNAFYRTANLVTLKIQGSVKHVSTGGYSISTYTNLAAIDVTTDNANYCSVQGVLFTKDMKTLVKFPEGKSRNGSYTIPNGVKEIAQYAFHAQQLTSLNFNQVEVIHHRAFYTSQRLGNINIPASTRVIAPGAFASMYNDVSVSVNANNSYFTVINNALYSANGDTLKYYPSGRTATSYDIAPNTVVVQSRAFESCPNILSVSIPQTVKVLEPLAFYSCTKLSTVRFLPTSTVQVIGDGCFNYCIALQSIAIPTSVQTIGSNTFQQCTALKTVTVAANSQLRSIGSNCFYMAPNLESWTFATPNSCQLDSIGAGAFRDTKLKSFVFPAKTRYIGESAFNGCRQLATVEFPAEGGSLRLDTICGGAFANTAFTLKDGDIPSSVRCIGREAFWNVKTAATINIRADSISPEAFKGCYQLRHININKDNSRYSSVDGMVLTKDKKTLWLFPPGKASDKFTLLAPSIERIGDYVFYGNAQLKNVVIPNKVTSIGRRAFGLCTALNTVTFLCDEMIDPANIAQGRNIMAFDNGLQAPSMFPNIAIHVRKEKLDKYQSSPFYSQFSGGRGQQGIFPSFKPIANNAEGTEEYIAVSQNAVDLLSTTSKDHTFVVPRTVSHEGTTYSVALVGDYAFQKATNHIKEVVVPGDVEYIGAKAFMTDIANNGSTVESVFLISGNVSAQTFATTRFELDDTGSDYSEFADATKVYVKKSVLQSAAFGDAVKRYTEGAATYSGTPVRPAKPDMFDYKIPGISINNTYGTFAREFDVDLADYFTEHGTGRVWAFTASDGKLKPGPGNGNVGGTYYLKMHSINEGATDGTDGTYIPAGTGVLLKAADGTPTTKPDYHYTIGENDVETPAPSTLVGVTQRKAEIADNLPNSKLYAMQGGVFRPLAGQTVTMQPHKAYLKIDNMPAGAKLAFYFNDSELPDDVITAVHSPQFTEDSSANGEIYDLQGRRVTAPSKGLYIKNGKKVIIK